MKKILWVLLDDRMGSVGQARGVLQALGSQFEIIEKNIRYSRWARIPNFFKGKSLLGVDTTKSSDLKGFAPDLVLSISRRTAPVARWIQKQSKAETRIIQLMHPGNVGLGDFDLIFVPEHDKGKKSVENMQYFIGCPHRVTETSIEIAKEKWESAFSHLPKPLTSIIVGGSIKGKPFSIENATQLGREIKNIHDKIGGSVLITTSRRTGVEAEKVIMSEIADIPQYTFLWGDKKENPFMGFLSCASKIIVTGDSVSMCSEACGTGVPVLIFSGKNWLTPKHHRFINSLFEGEYAISLNHEKSQDFKPKQKLNPANLIAKKIIDLN